ncbi:hypothetical protein Ab1vBOLIVR5_gp52 [Agrobacterium phage OLIVR5]|uniref:Uncharacterized protein n=1 Tax=Agrobacterium phage OLIVR5 TaxID=2723773 RepID=A0A858MUW4_9CAUD|nr:hypothetical protein KNU99_gp052 [Agrobacterium phage OLIVR5]QIW87700.1 hypothetical protein Ab1vBOLIVR5_gp52 [Agrobacterium phage OLIVR5]QIW87962.1 hypothetical protein Ab1vBOLIVR6_gp55 [Agrobacterium phage OLIVR6]
MISRMVCAMLFSRVDLLDEIVLDVDDEGLDHVFPEFLVQVSDFTGHDGDLLEEISFETFSLYVRTDLDYNITAWVPDLEIEDVWIERSHLFEGLLHELLERGMSDFRHLDDSVFVLMITYTRGLSRCKYLKWKKSHFDLNFFDFGLEPGDLLVESVVLIYGLRQSVLPRPEFRIDLSTIQDKFQLDVVRTSKSIDSFAMFGEINRVKELVSVDFSRNDLI